MHSLDVSFLRVHNTFVDVRSDGSDSPRIARSEPGSEPADLASLTSEDHRDFLERLVSGAKEIQEQAQRAANAATLSGTSGDYLKKELQLWRGNQKSLTAGDSVCNLGSSHCSGYGASGKRQARINEARDAGAATLSATSGEYLAMEWQRLRGSRQGKQDPSDRVGLHPGREAKAMPAARGLDLLFFPSSEVGSSIDERSPPRATPPAESGAAEHAVPWPFVANDKEARDPREVAAESCSGEANAEEEHDAGALGTIPEEANQEEAREEAKQTSSDVGEAAWAEERGHTWEGSKGGGLEHLQRREEARAREGPHPAEDPEEGISVCMSSLPNSGDLNPGSLGHPEMCLRTCSFFPQGRCVNGRTCTYCHLPHKKRPRRLDKRHREMLSGLSPEERRYVLQPILVKKANVIGLDVEEIGLSAEFEPVPRRRETPTRERRALLCALEAMSLRSLIACLRREGEEGACTSPEGLPTFSSGTSPRQQVRGHPPEWSS